MFRDGFASGSPGREAKSDNDDQRVIGLAQDGNEVRDEVDRGDQIHQQHSQPDPDPDRHVSIGGDTLQEEHHVWGETKKIRERRTTWVFALLEPKHENEDQPHQHQAADDDLPHADTARNPRSGKCESLPERRNRQ